MKTVAAILLACIVATTMADQVWTNCGASSDPLTIKNVAFNPYPIVRGQQLNITFEGALGSDIASGSIDLSVKYMGIQIFKKSFDICSSSPAVTCPIKAGPIDQTAGMNFPSYTPAGKYTGEIKGTDGSGNEIMCVDFAVQVNASEDVEEDVKTGLARFVNHLHSDVSSLFNRN